MAIELIEARRRDLGGFEVGRVLPSVRRRMVGPFIFLDHMGPARFEPGHGVDVRPHPHIGLSTVTYLFEGEILHRDNLGSVQAIRPGEVNWMTAGRGIVHSERTDPAQLAAPHTSHGLQAWVALPDDQEETAPAFHHHAGDDLPSYEAGGLWGRMIAGRAFGAEAKVHTHSPLFYIHWELRAGTRAGLPAEYSERAAYVVRGRIEVDGHPVRAGEMVVVDKGAPAVVTALEDSTVAALGGEPIGHRYIWWNLVSSTRERIEGAKADWAAGRMALPPGDDGDSIPLPPGDDGHSIPLPDDPPPEPEPMS